MIGQGTAAIAGQSLATVLRTLVGPALRADALPATELSGFELADDMSDTLVIAISQSGTTTDTNRTSDLARARGARGRGDRQPPQQRPRRQVRRCALHVRRPRRRDGGASTKAFYAQIAAGYLLAIAIADAVECAAADACPRAARRAAWPARRDAHRAGRNARPSQGLRSGTRPRVATGRSSATG